MFISLGTTLIDGFVLRLKEELRLPFGNLNIIEPPDRTNLSYIGGAKLKDPSSTNNLWINIDEYLETGPSILHRKGF
jgi:actin-related protein